MRTRQCHFAFGALMCAVVGCGTVEPAVRSPQVEFAFEEDAEPAVAALPFVATELLVQPYPGADGRPLSDLYARAGAVVIEELREIDTAVLQMPADRLHKAAAELSASGLVETVQKNYIFEAARTPNDPMFSQQPHLEQINVAGAWDFTLGGEDIVIAVVDTGLEADHPDLAGKVADGWNIFGGNTDFSDPVGHGTLVAGVAAAESDNATGVSGVAWNCPILAVRASDELGQATGRSLAAAILWAVNHDADVINVSFAPLWSNRIVRAAAQHAFNRGSLVVIAAGNEGGTTLSRGFPEALFVGAVNSSNRIASFSYRGPFVDLAAPGTGIRSTEIGLSYGLANGTSFAAPIVSGVVALCWSANPELRPVAIMNVLQDTAVDLGATGKDASYGHGMVDAAAAVQAAAALTALPDSTPPSLRIEQPQDGDEVYGRVRARVSAMDAEGVGDVVMSIDGIPFATDTRHPYQFVIDTTTFDHGVHELSFAATDAAGNASPSQTVMVTFAAAPDGSSDDPSGIVFTDPAAGAKVSGNVTIRATVSDADGLAVVEWFVNGESRLVATVGGTSTDTTFLWRTASESTGRHTISLIVTDLLGRQTTAQLELVTE